MLIFFLIINIVSKCQQKTIHEKNDNKSQQNTTKHNNSLCSILPGRHISINYLNLKKMLLLTV